MQSETEFLTIPILATTRTSLAITDLATTEEDVWIIEVHFASSNPQKM